MWLYASRGRGGHRDVISRPTPISGLKGQEHTLDLSAYRQRPIELQRTDSLMRMLDSIGGTVLDVGARDGYFASLLTSSFSSVVALDLNKPEIADQGVMSVKGDVTSLEFSDNSFDAVVCTEVLEHIPPGMLTTACDELSRVAKQYVLVGVPFKQDTRVGRTACMTCGRSNPPWGHVNVFDERRLQKLFPHLQVKQVSFVGTSREKTNVLSALLMDFAGNPFGTYNQDEGCIFCGSALRRPPQRSLGQRVLTRAAAAISRLQRPFIAAHPNWIHMLFRKAG